ncbi:hypothetical protein P154DRAFT_618653 [Amniculicola lignicola CBS 123094]|uniref:Uncharacterized protein n=1 Tax=Amniculicola lignicola CBS 123094 TaxID=1392246 RepID=A0A6A5WT33_9PLEO|nr:hypothetical protein P154DRAFT_618653 [Amniculicola lignicola CBS 123094]
MVHDEDDLSLWRPTHTAIPRASGGLAVVSDQAPPAGKAVTTGRGMRGHGVDSTPRDRARCRTSGVGSHSHLPYWHLPPAASVTDIRCRIGAGVPAAEAILQRCYSTNNQRPSYSAPYSSLLGSRESATQSKAHLFAAPDIGFRTGGGSRRQTQTGAGYWTLEGALGRRPCKCEAQRHDKAREDEIGER